MVNEMLIAGLLLVGTVDHVLEKQVRVEYTLRNQDLWMDVPLLESTCEPIEGMHVLFYQDGIIECFCGGKND